MNSGKERLKLIDERINLQIKQKQLEALEIELNNEKLEFLKEKEMLLKENEELLLDNVKLKEEILELEDISKMCRICFRNRRIQLKCCSGGMCIECWDKHEAHNTKCPFCRAHLPRLVDTLMDKIKTINK